MTAAEFRKLVDEALAGLPEEFRSHLENVAVIVEAEPTPELLERANVDGDDTLLGFYEGTPLTERGYFDSLQPDVIWIFQNPIEEFCDSPEQIREEVQTTVMHEIAHHFGIDDDRLDDLGY